MGPASQIEGRCGGKPDHMWEIALLPIGGVDRSVVDWLALAIEDSLKMTCLVEENQINPEAAFQPMRRQYHSTRLLELLQAPGNTQRQKRLGITDVDLFIPILTFVFGEAQLNNTAAVISTCRLRQEFYGLPTDDISFLKRVEKEALHELGHTFGLVHCPKFDCVMHFSNSIEEIDLKSNAFCSLCAAGLRAQGNGHPS